MSLFRKAKSYHVTKRGTSMLLILLLILQMGAVSACKRSKPAKIAAKDGEYLFAAYQNNACEECMKEADLYSVYDTKEYSNFARKVEAIILKSNSLAKNKVKKENATETEQNPTA